MDVNRFKAAGVQRNFRIDERSEDIQDSGFRHREGGVEVAFQLAARAGKIYCGTV